MIDEYPVLAVAAACAQGRTVMRGLAELRVKESDRLAGIAEGLAACGVSCRIEGDDLIVEGSGGPPARRRGDRDAASITAWRWRFSCSAWRRANRCAIDDARPIATSFPDFVPLMRRLGAGFATGS